MKKSVLIYRTIKGVKFTHMTSDPSLFDECKKEAKKAGLKYRIVKGEFLVQTEKANHHAKS